MPGVQDTAYPRLKNYVKQRELKEIYTPTDEEKKLVLSPFVGFLELDQI